MIEFQWVLEKSPSKDYEFSKFNKLYDLKLYIIKDGQRIEADEFDGDV